MRCVELYVCRELFATTRYPGVLTTIPEKVVVEVSREVFRKMVYRESSDGVVALAKPKEHKLGDLRLGSNPFVIILEAVEKPGNLGAVLRTADAAGVDAVVVCDPRTDLYNPTWCAQASERSSPCRPLDARR